MRRMPWFTAAAVLIIVSTAGCNYPGLAAPTPFGFPTSDLTQTAVLEPVASLQPAATETQMVNPESTATGLAGSPTILPAASETASPTQTNMPPQATQTTIPPTQAPAPTNTSRPANSGAPAARSGTSFTAAYLDDSPTLDGSFDEWTLDRYRIERVVAGSGEFSGEQDLSGRAMFGWDEDYLYIAVRVQDDVYAQNATGEDLFKGDSLEILLDTNVPADYYVQSLSPDDFQLGISPGSAGPGDDPEAYLWFPRNVEGPRGRVEIGAMRVDDGYRVEAAIPWNTFEVSPRSGQHFGFAFSISDNDRAGEEVQQSMVSSAQNRSLTDPTTWGDLTLGGAPVSNDPPDRTGAAVEAVFTSDAPDINANLSDWDSSRHEVSTVVYGRNAWSGNSDLSGDLRLAWDDNNLYLGLRVFDDRYVQGETGEELFLGDSLEILLDSNLQADLFVQSLSPDDYQLGISPGSPGAGNSPEAYLWYPRGIAGGRSQVRAAARGTEDGYILEAAIPWSVFEIDPDEGDEFGFVFSISDNDASGEDRQESMVATSSSRTLTDPTTWGSLELVSP